MSPELALGFFGIFIVFAVVAVITAFANSGRNPSSLALIPVGIVFFVSAVTLLTVSLVLYDHPIWASIVPLTVMVPGFLITLGLLHQANADKGTFVFAIFVATPLFVCGLYAVVFCLPVVLFWMATIVGFTLLGICLLYVLLVKVNW